jgi:hypothetical protein
MTKNQMYLLKTYQGTLLSEAFDDVEEFFINAVMTIIVNTYVLTFFEILCSSFYDKTVISDKYCYYMFCNYSRFQNSLDENILGVSVSVKFFSCALPEGTSLAPSTS